MSEFEVDWETLHRYGVQDGRREVTSRMPVPGGWLYRYTAMDGPDVLHVTMCFVPHTNHSMEGLARAIGTSYREIQNNKLPE